MSKFVPGQKVYYAGNSSHEMEYVSFGEELKYVKSIARDIMIPFHGKKDLSLVVNIRGEKVILWDDGLSESKPEDSIECIADRIRSVFLRKAPRPKPVILQNFDEILKANNREWQPSDAIDQAHKSWHILDAAMKDCARSIQKAMYGLKLKSASFSNEKMDASDLSGFSAAKGTYGVLDLSNADEFLYVVTHTKDSEIDFLCECKSYEKARKIVLALLRADNFMAST